jgi:Ca2+-binding EF-hand superfamily protein
MGACSSVPPHIPSTYSLTPSAFTRLNTLTEILVIPPSAVESLRVSFEKLDYDKDGTVSLPEFLAVLNVEKTKFNVRAFEVIDCSADGKVYGGGKTSSSGNPNKSRKSKKHQQGSGSINFLSFVACVYNYCTMDWSTLVRFTFDMFDNDNSGYLDISEVERLVCCVQGTKTPDARSKKVLGIMDDDNDSLISLEEFLKYNRKFPSLLFPAFSLQTTMRRKVLGEAFWKARTKELQLLYTTKGITVKSAIQDSVVDMSRDVIRVAERDRAKHGGMAGVDKELQKKDKLTLEERVEAKLKAVQKKEKEPIEIIVMPKERHQYDRPERPVTNATRSESVYESGLEGGKSKAGKALKKKSKPKAKITFDTGGDDKENANPSMYTTSSTVTSHTISLSTSLSSKSTSRRPSSKDIRAQQRELAEKQIEMNSKFRRKKDYDASADFSENARRASATSVPAPPPASDLSRSPFKNISNAFRNRNNNNNKRPAAPNTPPAKKPSSRTPFSPAALMNSPHAVKMKNVARSAKNLIMSPFSAKKKKKAKKEVRFDSATPVKGGRNMFDDMMVQDVE